MSRMTRKPRMFGTKPKKLSRACWTLSPMSTAARGMRVPPDRGEGKWAGPEARGPRGGAGAGRTPDAPAVPGAATPGTPVQIPSRSAATLPPLTSAWMRIGELSRRTGVSPELLRAWERRYSLLRPRRTDGRTRLWSEPERDLRGRQAHLTGLDPGPGFCLYPSGAFWLGER